MTYLRNLVRVALAFAILLPLGCGTDAPPKGSADSIRGDAPSPSPIQPVRIAPANPAQPPQPAVTPRTAISNRSDIPVAPPDARYTLVCFTFTGRSHYQDAVKSRQALMQKENLRDWYIVQSAAESTLYYGFYKAMSDHEARDPALTAQQKRDIIADATRAQADKKAIDALTNDRGDRPFKQSFFVNLDSSDPLAPPEWNLANLRQSSQDKAHYWSLQIAAYKDDPRRKQAAVDTVREARAQGLPAYFFHGETVSSVCLGVWNYNAVREQQTNKGESADAKAVIVISDRPLPPAMIEQLKHHGKIVVLTPKVEILDPNLLDTMKKFPRHTVNGDEIRRKAPNARGGYDDVFDPSFLVVIPPRTQGRGPVSDPASPAAEDPLERIQLHPSAPPTGGGKLRSFGDK